MRIRRHITCLTLLVSGFLGFVKAQPTGYREYMQSVAKCNAGLLAEQMGIDVAEASIQAAKTFKDPELSFAYTNNQDWNLQMGQSVEVGVSYDLDVAGVRRSRIRVAKTERDLTAASVASYLSTLRLQAAEAWVQAWKLQKQCAVLRSSLEDMRQMQKADSTRLTTGDISRTEALQSKLTTETLQGELLTAEAEYRNSLLQLSHLAGGLAITQLDEGDLQLQPCQYTQEEACRMAEENRAELKAAELAHTLSGNNLKLINATRGLELSLNLGYIHAMEVRNQIAPAPRYNGFTVGFAMPLKFSSLNKGEKQAAQLAVEQSRRQYEEARQQVRLEAAQAYNTLEAAGKVVQEYDATMLKDAAQVLSDSKEAFLAGEASLAEYLEATSAHYAFMKAYYEAYAHLFLSHLQLEHATQN